MKFGLLGHYVSHSFSPRIHNALGNTNYELFEREPSQLQKFFADQELQGINITFPYKVNALEACDGRPSRRTHWLCKHDEKVP